MKISMNELLNYFKFQNRLKTVLRNNWTQDGRKESSAEHSWSVAVMVWFLTKNIEEELGIKIDQNKAIKMALIHDIVEIEAGDVAAWDKEGREQVKLGEMDAITNISNMLSSTEVHELWLEHEKRETIESKLVKACDQLCPLIYRVVFENSYEGTTMTPEKLDAIFLNIVSFSETTKILYAELVKELQEKKLLIR